MVEVEPLDPGVAAAAADVYLRAGEDRAALTVLLRAELAERAAALVAALPSDRLDRLDHSELGALVEVLPAEALERHPRVLIHFARACQPAAQVRARTQALERAQAIVGHRDGPVRRELEAELGLDLIRDERPEEAEALVSAVLAKCSEEELATKARGLDVLGRVAALRGDDESLREAEALLNQALVLCRALGQEGWAAQVLIALVDRIYYARGQHALAMERIDELLRGLTGRSGHRAVVLGFRAGILIDCGRFAEAEATIAEARRLIDLTGDQRAAGYVAWDEARLASQRGAAAATVSALVETEAHRADWFQHSTGAEFLADAADLLDRVGEHDAASAYLARARERAAEAELSFAVADAAILARSGDPVAARAALGDVLRSPRLHRREAWRLALLTAYAALRAGDPDAGALAAAAFDEAAALGVAALPQAREPKIAERLLELAAGAGSASAARLAADRPPLEISLLGRFTVSRAGQVLAIPEGRPQALVKLVAASGGAIPAEEAIEALWPEAPTESGRRGLRNVLNRLRRSAGEVIVRAGADLRLPEGARVDAVTFERDAGLALAGEPDPGAARSALAHYRGELLPEEPYEPWAGPARERARSLFVRLLDLLAEQVESEGDLDEALRLLEQAIEADPYDDRRYLISARILAAQGRYGSATQMLARGAETMRRLGLEVPAAFDKLAETTRDRAGAQRS
jgi:DNA-binding SARP family transcriptional activator